MFEFLKDIGIFIIGGTIGTIIMCIVKVGARSDFYDKKDLLK